jgi:hypothetical protein
MIDGGTAGAGVARNDEAQMERRTPIFIVCSPLPHVGKTLVARLLAEYLHTSGRTVAAFDVNPDDFALAEQLPDRTAKADIGGTKGQMALFDQLIVADETSKVVDLGYRCFDQFFKVMQEIDFEAEARGRSIAPVVLFISEPDQRSTQAYAMLQERFPELPLVPVLNAGAEAITRNRSGIRPKYAKVPLQIPLLPILKTTLQRAGAASAALGRLTADDMNELRAEFERVLLQFRELELRLLLEEFKPALRLRA